MKPKTIIISEKQLNKIKDTIDKDNHKGCLMIRYDLPIMKKIQAKIKSEDLYVNEEEDINGFPNHIHITVLYGLHKKYRSIYGLLGMAEHQYNIDDCQALFTDISFFENNEKYDVMILDVISPELENLNYILRTRCEYQNDYPDYHPHCTIAYLKKGCADKYRDLRLEEPVLGKPVEWLYSFDRNIIDTDNRLHETKTFMRIRGEIDWKEKFLYEFVNRSIGIGKTKHLIGQEFQNKDNPDCDFYNRLTTADGKTNIIQIEFKHDEINIIDNIISRLDAYGWFPNDKDYMKQINSLKNKGEKSIYITFEPKYDIEITGKIGTQSLYHVTPTINWLGKISKIGLCPKSQCKKALHPERVYIFPNEELKDGVSTFLSGELYKAKKQLKSKHGKDERGVMYSVLQISMQGVDHFDKRFFKDSYSKGYWTKDNIPPEWIKEISRYTIDNDGSFKLLQGVNLFENTMKTKKIIISEKQLDKIKDKILTEEKEEVTFYQFKGEFQEFLKSLLEHPITCNVSSFWTSRGFSKKKMIEYLVKVGILEKEEKVNTDSIDGPQLEVSYKVLKSGFERKIKRMFIKLFEGETKDSTKLLVESINENIRYEDIDPSQINLQSFQPKSELNPRFFPDGEELLKRTRLRLLEVADDFIDELDLPFAEHKDIHIVGSIVGYNWSKYSDVDLHIIYDFDEIDKRTHFVREYMDSKKNIWNETKKIRIYGYDVELYVENIHEPAESNGRYSLESNLWVQKPVIPEPITYQKEFIKEKSAKFINLIDQYVKDFEQFTDEKNDSKLLLLSKNCNKLWSKIKGMRKVGIERGAEQDPLNIIFKVLRRAESLKKLYDLKNQLYIYNKSIR